MGRSKEMRAQPEGGDEAMTDIDILFVERHPLVVGVVSEALTLAGYRVEHTPSADEAWEILQERGVRAVLTDHRTFGDRDWLSGLDLARNIRSLSPTTVVIMLATQPPEEARLVCDAVLAKPASVTLVVQTLYRLGVRPRSNPERSAFAGRETAVGGVRVLSS